MFLDNRGVTHRTFPKLRDLIVELGGGRLDAVVADAPFLKWAISEGRKAGEFESVGVLPYEFEPQSHGFALPEDPDLEESVNRALFTVLRQPESRHSVRLAEEVSVRMELSRLAARRPADCGGLARQALRAGFARG